MKDYDDPNSGGEGADSAPDGYEDTVVEILSVGDEGDAEPQTSAGKSPSTNAEVRRLELQLEGERERMLRLRADFDNYRKRTERERAEIERYALSDALRELLPVVDNLERALAVPGAQGAAAEASDLRKGVEMIVRQFHELLKRYGLVPIAALGERFDPSVHEAVFQEESESVLAPTVSVELQRGYRLNERLLRPSLVKVAVPKETTDDDSEPDSSQ